MSATTATDAPLRKERRTNFPDYSTVDRKSGGAERGICGLRRAHVWSDLQWHPCELTADPSASLGMTRRGWRSLKRGDLRRKPQIPPLRFAPGRDDRKERVAG